MDHDQSSVRIAVLIDADNASPRYAGAILEELAKYGTPTIKRAYGDFSTGRLQGWTRELNRHAIRAMHQNAFTSGKNSTDSALIIDAMDLLYAGNVEAFALVTSDSDFTSLATRLREAGKTVYGMGQQKTPVSLKNACDRFILLEVLGSTDDPAAPTADQPAAAASPTSSAPEDTTDSDTEPQLNLQSVLTRAVNATADDDGWAHLGTLGQHLSRTHPSWDPRTFGHPKLSALVADQPYLQTRNSGNTTHVSLKRKAPAKKSGARTATKKTATKTAAKKS